MTAQESIKWYPKVRVAKWSPEQVERAARKRGVNVDEVTHAHLISVFGGDFPEDEAHGEGNILTTVGLARITSLITGGGGQAMTNAQMMAGVGDTATAPAVGNTDLSAATGATHRYVQGVDATYPTVANGVITAFSTFTSANGNFAWLEWAWGIATGTLTPGTGSWASIAATSAVMLNHSNQSLGTKVSGAVWVLQATLTLS
jgi:hypothetical protein